MGPGSSEVAHLPTFAFPCRPPSALAMLRHAISDPAKVIPASILDTWSFKVPGPRSPIVVTKPDAIRTILLGKGETFGRNRPLRTLMRRAWGRGLAAAEGEAWALQRRAASPAFRPQAINATMFAMIAATDRAHERWPRAESVDLQPAIGRIVAEIVMETLLSGADGLDTDSIAADIPVVVRDVARFGLLDISPLPGCWLDRVRRTGRSSAEARVRQVAASIAARRATGAEGEHDLPALLRNVAPLADNVFGFMIAGFERSALGAAWAIYLLARHPDWQEAVRAEARSAQEHTARPIARAVVQEALRLYPPAPLLARAAIRHTQVLEHSVRPGQAVIIPVFAIHRHRRLWDHPDRFDPDRFRTPDCHDRNAYLPFGAGPRLCIAAGFAQTEMTTIVSGLTRDLRFEAAPGRRPDISLKVSTHSTNGLHVTAQPAA